MASTISAGTTSGTAIAITGDTSGALALLTNNGTTAVTIDTSQRVAFVAGTAALPAITTTGDTDTGVWFPAANTVAASTSGTEAMRIDSSGNLLVGTTSAGCRLSIAFSSNNGPGIITNDTTPQNGNTFHQFRNNGTTCGAITSNGTTTTAYGTSSDYRLKDNVAPMTGALGKVSQLKPVTYTWKIDGRASQGFIAHELQEVCPDAVTGVKDEVDAESNPIHQAVDVSFLVATLTAAIQEQQAMIIALQTDVQALKATPLPAENE